MRAVDDQHLADHARGRQALLAPVDEVADRELLVEGRDHDRELGIIHVGCREQQLESGMRGPTDRA